MSRRRAVVGAARAATALLVLLATGTAVASGRAASPTRVEPASAAATAGAAASARAAHRLGVPPNGPDVLYQSPPALPQLQNRDARFRAPFDMVSGTERYLGGEYEYTDFVYDDDAATYPDDFTRYAGNAGDLFEFRLSDRDASGMAFRFTLNTLTAPDSTMIALAFDTDADSRTGSSTLPRDPGMPFPGTDQVLTTWGTGAQWSIWSGGRWVTSRLPVRADTVANQITVTLPRSVARPAGRWHATLATGLYDRSTGGWLSLPATTRAPGVVALASTSRGSNIINLGFRFNEVEPTPRTDASDGSPDAHQNAALAAGDPTRFSHVLDFELLRRRGHRSSIRTHGMLYRIFPSRMKTVLVSTDGNPAKGNPRWLGEGKDITSLHARYLSPLQPYALYVPTGYVPGRPAPLTYWLHVDNGHYWDIDGSSGTTPVVRVNQTQLAGESRNSILLGPAARGFSGYYVGDLEFDLLEAWADVARHYTLDPTRTTVLGYSMGSYGTYRMALLWPHLFARAVAIAPPMCRGLWTIAACSTTEDTVLARWTENARNIPIFHLADALSETTFYPGQVQLVLGKPVNGLHSLDSLGYRYTFWSVAADHIALGLNHPQITEFLGQSQVEPTPFHVTFARMPSTDLPRYGLLHNRAYWLSGIEVRSSAGPLAKGVIDAVSLGFGKADPTSYQTATAGVTATDLPYVETRRVWNDPGRLPATDTILLRATNIGSVTIDPAAAHADCGVRLKVVSDGPIRIRLLGCGR